MKKHKRLIIVFTVLVLASGAACWVFLRPDNRDSQPAAERENGGPVQDDGKLRLIATGDTIAHDSINANAKSGQTYDYLKLMSGMKPFFDKADLRFCNQATPAGGQKFGITGYPVFNAPLEFTHDMVRLGCNVVNIGTNHTNDKGQSLINAAVREWEGQDVLAFAGANRSLDEKSQIKTFEVEGVRFAFLAYSTYTNTPVSNGYGVTMYTDALARQQLTRAREQADIVIVSMRWGTEYSSAINTGQDRLAQNLADYGADVILGHGPHVLQPVKKLNASDGREAISWFSLGNFLNSQIDIESQVSGLAIMDIDTASKKVTSIGFMPVYQHYEWTAEQKRREDLLARKNFQLVPLDTGAELLAKSQNDTTVEEQTAEIKELLNKFTAVPIITSTDY